MLKIGTSGFSFPDWRGTVYPKKLQPKDALYYYNDELGFDTVEINSTYYTLLSEKSFEAMEQKTLSGFEFVVKGFRGITHNIFDPRISKDRPDLPQVNEYIDRFIYSLKPLQEKGKLGGVLLQFPVFFNPEPESKEYLLMCKEKFRSIPAVIEFRNVSWAKPETFEFLKNNGLGYCVVDEPKLPRLMPFMNEVTSDLGYIRLHGRNKNWFNATLSERYDYFYSGEELDSFIPDIKKNEKNSKKSYVFFNNCHTGSALKNALTLKEKLGLLSSEGKLFDL